MDGYAFSPLTLFMPMAAWLAIQGISNPLSFSTTIAVKKQPNE
jgi:hypothetical protein